MNIITRPIRSRMLMSAAAVVALTCGPDRVAGAVPPEGTPPVATGLPEDGPLASCRIELLDLAFGAATAMPLEPHLKSRSRAQEAVVAACIDLDQPRRALRYIEQIDNWRRGSGYADLAFYCARRGYRDEASVHLAMAVRIADDTKDWRRDRIRVKVARTHALLGEEGQAAALEAGVVDSEAGKLEGLRTARDGVAAFDAHLEGLDEVVRTDNFELVRNALEGSTRLFDRFYEDAERRARLEEKIKASWQRMPIMIRLELMMEMIGTALEHEDQATALRLVNESQQIVEDVSWDPEYLVPVRARLAGLRFRAGDVETARLDAKETLALYDAHREHIKNFERATALRPLAEAYVSMNDAAAAMSVYRRVVEDGAENPNARTRANDLVATCVSMAANGTEPDAALWNRLRRIREGLGDPW